MDLVKFNGKQRVDPADILNYLQNFILPALGGGGGGGGGSATAANQATEIANLVSLNASNNEIVTQFLNQLYTLGLTKDLTENISNFVSASYGVLEVTRDNATNFNNLLYNFQDGILDQIKTWLITLNDNMNTTSQNEVDQLVLIFTNLTNILDATNDLLSLTSAGNTTLASALAQLVDANAYANYTGQEVYNSKLILQDLFNYFSSNGIATAAKQDTGNTTLASILAMETDTNYKVSFVEVVNATLLNIQNDQMANLTTVIARLTTANTNLTTVIARLNTGNGSLATINTNIASELAYIIDIRDKTQFVLNTLSDIRDVQNAMLLDTAAIKVDTTALNTKAATTIANQVLELAKLEEIRLALANAAIANTREETFILFEVGTPRIEIDCSGWDEISLRVYFRAGGSAVGQFIPYGINVLSDLRLGFQPVISSQTGAVLNWQNLPTDANINQNSTRCFYVKDLFYKYIVITPDISNLNDKYEVFITKKRFRQKAA